MQLLEQQALHSVELVRPAARLILHKQDKLIQPTVETVQWKCRKVLELILFNNTLLMVQALDQRESYQELVIDPQKLISIKFLKRLMLVLERQKSFALWVQHAGMLKC